MFDLGDRGANRGLSFEPELSFERRAEGGWRYSVRVGSIFADTRLARTFYEVAPTEATTERPAYAARGGFVAWRLVTSLSRSLGPDWRLFALARVESVAEAANRHSPLVRQTTGTSLGVGFAYTWMRSEQRARD